MLRKVFRSVVIRVYRLLFHLISYLPVRENLIMFESFLGKQFSDNPRAIYEYLSKHYPDFELHWSIDKRYFEKFKSEDISVVKRLSIEWLWLMPRARYWVTNTRLPNWIRKPAHTTYLQTWHGTPLKKLGMDIQEVHMPGTTTETYKENFIKEAGKWDYLVSPNTYSTEIFKRAFQFKNEVLETGYPRNDYLIHYQHSKKAKELKARLGIPHHKKVVLYAPTWRDDDYFAKGKYKFTLQLDLDQFQQELGHDFVLLLRMHYLIANQLGLNKFEGFAYDVSTHDDLRELYVISDVLITDYSSVFFDYLCLKRPIIFFTYDIDTYRDKLRGFYFDFEEDAPGPLVKNTEQVIASIKEIEKNGLKPSDSLLQFHQKFCHLEQGRSTERVVNRVFGERKTE
jgi:CDP-glycerol glycerophosphotransferase